MSKTQEEREAEVDALIARAKDPDDPYDGHHGTDRSPESLEWARVNDPATFERVMGKIERGE
jgi:hypothetical protein